MRMPRTMYKEETIIQKTQEVVRGFYDRDIIKTTHLMSDDFMYIGPNDFQWSKGSDEFKRITEKELHEPAAIVSDEEYHLLFHERGVWVVYGRYKIMAALEDDNSIYAHVRCTFIWKLIKGELSLVHIHSSHAQDIPLSQAGLIEEPFTEDTEFFAYLKQLALMNTNLKRLSFRDREKHYRYLLPSEILYLKAAGQCTIVYTKNESFEVWGLLADFEKKLPEMFHRIHKSYLVNCMQIDSIQRYRAKLKYSATELPISKERYMELKRYLQR